MIQDCVMGSDRGGVVRLSEGEFGQFHKPRGKRTTGTRRSNHIRRVGCVAGVTISKIYCR